MFDWLKNILGQAADPNGDQDQVQSFEQDTADIPDKAFHHTGVQSIDTDKIVGSVGRAHELDRRFRYRERANTARYYSIEQAVRQGRPMDPIKVVKVKRGREDSEYYVMDGHHRVAHAKKFGYPEINADITEVVEDLGDAKDTHGEE